MVITFKFTKNKSPIALTNELVRCVVGSDIKEVKAQVNSKIDQAFYRNLSRYEEDFGIGTYFSIKTETGYVFAFVSSDRSTATIKFREFKNSSYKTISYKLVMSAKNHDCYVVNTKNNEIIEEQAQEIELSEIEIVAEDKDAIIARLMAENAALKSENEVLKNENAQLKEIAVVAERKRGRAVRSCYKARNEMKVMRKVKAAGHDVSAYYLNKESTERALEMMAGGF